MKFPLAFFLALFTLSLPAQKQDSIPRKPHKVRFGFYSSGSYQITVNGNDVQTNLGNAAFKGYFQAGFGIGIRYQQDSTEFALVTASIGFINYTLSSQNIIEDNGNSYNILNHYDMSNFNAGLEASYHRRVAPVGMYDYLSLEAGAGIHMIDWAGATYSGDTAVGPYSITRTLESDRNPYFIPSAQIGMDLTVRNPLHKTEFVFGLRAQMYLAKFAEVQFDMHYTNTNTTLNYYIHYAPELFTPKAYVMVVF